MRFNKFIIKGVSNMDFIFGNSYIELKSGPTIYVEEHYDELRSKMKDSSLTITVHVIDFFGLDSELKTFNKSDISYYGSN